MDTIEGNTLIAEFMGAEKTPDDKHFKFIYPPSEISVMVFKTIHLKYHNSFEWLMRVVDKIESMTNNLKPSGLRLNTTMISFIENDTNRYLYSFTIIFNQHPKFNNIEVTRFGAIYQCVIQFIQWYNTTSWQ